MHNILKEVKILLLQAEQVIFLYIILVLMFVYYHILMVLPLLIMLMETFSSVLVELFIIYLTVPLMLL